MEAPDIAPEPEEFQPSSTQLERAAELRRFNRLYIYAPVTALSLVVIVAVIWLLLFSVSPEGEDSLTTISALADTILLVWTILAMLLCAIFPGLALFLTIQARQNDISPVRQTQFFLWRVDYELSRVRMIVGDNAPKFAQPFIWVRARWAYIRALFNRL